MFEVKVLHPIESHNLRAYIYTLIYSFKNQ